MSLSIHKELIHPILVGESIKYDLTLKIRESSRKHEFFPYDEYLLLFEACLPPEKITSSSFRDEDFRMRGGTYINEEV